MIGSKNTGFEEKLAECVAQACVQVMPEDARKFDTDCVRCAKVIGGSAGMTQVGVFSEYPIYLFFCFNSIQIYIRKFKSNSY